MSVKRTDTVCNIEIVAHMNGKGPAFTINGEFFHYLKHVEKDAYVDPPATNMFLILHAFGRQLADLAFATELLSESSMSCGYIAKKKEGK